MRAGTRKSRAPSGVERVRNGVSISRKSRSSRISANRRDDPVTELERLAHRRAAKVERAVAQPQVLLDRRRPRRSGTAASRRRRGLDQCGDRRARSRRSASFGLTFAGSRRTTVPNALTTSSERSACAAACASGALSGCRTSWTMPERSRRSMKISPPWSRRRCTQPATRAGVPVARRGQLAAPGVAVARSHRGGCFMPAALPRRIAGITAATVDSCCSPDCHLLQAGALRVVHDRNVSRPEPICVLELRP